MIKHFEENKMDYLKTFLITLSIVIMFGVLNIGFMIHNIFNVEQSSHPNIDAAFETYLVDVLIDKNLQFAKNFPKNYAINMRLGILYSYKKDYISAEREFHNALEKSAAYDFAPSYQLAKLYVKTNRLQEAQYIMDKINERPDKKLIRYKGNIYKSLGDAYFKQESFGLAVQKYMKAITYYNVINYRELSKTEDDYVKSCIALADKYVEFGNIEDAVLNLENAYLYRPENILLNYKLGLLYANNDIYKAFDFLKYVNKNNPQLLNHEMYYNMILKMSEIEHSKGNYTNSELYKKRANQYLKFVQNNLLDEKDLFTEIMRFDINNDLAAKEYIINLQFRLQNNSNLDIENFYVKAIFKDGDNVIQSSTQKLFDETRIFKAETTTPPIFISASESYNTKNHTNNDINVTVYAYKYPKYAIKIFDQSIKKPSIEH